MAEDKSEFTCYEDDPCIGKDIPDLSSLQLFNGHVLPNFNDESKIILITFFSKLNKADFPTFTVLNDIMEMPEFKGNLEILAISRDGEASDVEKFPSKYKDQFQSEVTGPKGEAGYMIKFDYPLAFDPGNKVNTEFKKVAQKAVVGVGMTFVVKGKKIQWFEYYIRGNTPMNQMVDQLKRLFAGKELLSNGPMPVEEEQTLDDGNVPAKDPFAGIGDNY